MTYGRLSRITMLLALVCAPPVASAQDHGLLQLRDPLHEFLLRQRTAGHLERAVLSHRPLSAAVAQQYLDSLVARADDLSRSDRELLARYRRERPAPGAERVRRLIGGAYRNGHDLVELEGEGYALRLNPLLYADYGRARVRQRSGDTGAAPSWTWARGAGASGRIGPYVFFETRLAEHVTHLVWADLDDDFIDPRRGLVTPREEDFVLRDDLGDYWTATGVVGVRTSHFEARFGRDRYHWGPGFSSVVLSNYAPPYDHLQLRTTLGPVQYSNLFAGLAEPRFRDHIADVIVPRKYFAAHRLAVNLPGRVEVGVFESVVFATDTLGARQGFDLAYLNPVIFYRAAERDRGSPDNVLLGGDVAWGVRDGVRIYAQIVFDEFVASAIGTDDWRNRWGWLAGFHLADRPLSGLSLQVEYARLRPYLYSHENTLNSYVHYNGLLGHPAGPNAVDLALFLTYRPRPRVAAFFTAAYTRRGRSPQDVNYGGDPLLPYTTRASDEAPLLRGVRETYFLLEAAAGYELLPGLYAEAALRTESLDDAVLGVESYVTPSLRMRWNMVYGSVRW